MPDLVLYDHSASICSQMARLALVEKGLPFARHPVDIMETNEQFEPWYVALNPRAVVPTLRIGDTIVTDTIRIVNRVQQFPGPDLSGDETTQAWLTDIMGLHYGVLLYRRRLRPDGTAVQIEARREYLERLLAERPDLAELVARRLEGNRRMRSVLASPAETERHVREAMDLVDRMAAAVAGQDFLAGDRYSLADCFATAALARFTIHGFAGRWRDTPLRSYYDRMRARPSFVEAQVIETGSESDL